MNHLSARHRAAVLGLSLLALAAAVAVGLFIDVRADATGKHLSFLGMSGIDREIFLYIRLPRVLAAVVIGAGLSSAGCVFQATLRNPLADPFTLGISSGSALAAVIGIRFGVDQALGVPGVGACALLGAVTTVALVWRLGRVGRSLPPATLLLAGVTVAALCGATSMLVQYTADFTEVYRMVRWMMGGLDAITWRQLAFTAALVIAGTVAVNLFARHLNALSAGADSAASLGVRVERTTGFLLACSAVIVGATIALAGPIGFIGLLVPHILRTTLGPDHRLLMPVAALGGAVLLVVCDAIAREALAPLELPVGVITAILGGSFFLRLLAREKSRAGFWVTPT